MSAPTLEVSEFCTTAYTLTTAFSISIQFWLIFTIENVKFEQKWRELNIKSESRMICNDTNT